MRIGNYNLYSIETSEFALDGGAMFGVVPRVLWSKTNPPDENNLCPWAMRSLLVENGDKLILIDNGIGDKQDDNFLRHYYLHGDMDLHSSLAKHGFSANCVMDIPDILECCLPLKFICSIFFSISFFNL